MFANGLFDVPLIDEKEQKRLIVNALSKYDHEFPAVLEKSMCKSCDRKPVIPCDPYVNFLCVDCLTKCLCESRMHVESGMIIVKFAGISADIRKFKIRITDMSHASILKGRDIVKIVQYRCVPINPATDKIAKYTLIIDEPVEYKGESLSGEYIMPIIGNYVCTNFITSDHGCAGYQDNGPKAFISETVPRGYSGWKEKKTIHKVVTMRYCYACARRYNENLGDQPPDAKLRSQIMSKLEYEDLDKSELISELISTKRELDLLKNKLRKLTDS